MSSGVGMTSSELNMRAMLTTIRTTEGHGTSTAYDVKYGGAKFTDNSDHPGGGTFTEKQKDGTTKEVYHSPAGAYQITEGTYNLYKDKAGVSDFSPTSQDKVAVSIIEGQKGAYSSVVNGNVETSFQLLKSQWSSLPGATDPGMSLGAAKMSCKDKQILPLHKVNY